MLTAMISNVFVWQASEVSPFYMYIDLSISIYISLSLSIYIHT